MMSGHVTQAGQSVLDQLGLDQGFIVKAKLAQRLARSIVEMGLSQREAAALLPIAQPKLSLITRGKLEDISQGKLEECLRALGHDIEISISKRHEGSGEVRVREFA
jgi:predicted XRE-type DNA-binding protein